MSTRKALIPLIARELGGQSGNIGSGGATTAVLTELTAALPDDELNGYGLLMLDAANATDTERLISDYTGSTATATWVGNRTDTTYTSETWATIPKGVNRTLNDLRLHLNDALKVTYRQVPVVLATEETTRTYRLSSDWLTKVNDILGVHRRDSPNVVDNEGFDKWQNGAASAPDSFVLSGSGGTVARVTTFALGRYAAELTRVGTDTFLTYSLPWTLVLQLRGKTFAVGAWAECGTASRAQVKLDDGVAQATALGTVTGYPEWITATQTISAAATKIEISVGVVTGNVAAVFSRLAGQEGSAIDTTLRDYGSQAYPLQEVGYTKDVGSVTLQSPRGRGGQLVVYTKRAYATLSADTDATDCPDDIAVAGAMYQLASARRVGDDTDRMTAWATKHANAYGALSGRLLRLPVPRPQTQIVIGA